MDAGRANWNENEQNAKFRARSFPKSCARDSLSLACLFMCAQNNGYVLLFVWKPWDTLIYQAIIPLCWQRMQYTGLLSKVDGGVLICTHLHELCVTSLVMCENFPPLLPSVA